jgi:nucleoside-diphosphate-sugar epimerase
MNVLVTGGGGFLGAALCKALVARGYTVRSYSRAVYPQLLDWGVECRQGDLADADRLRRAAEGCDAVFHVAAKAGVWGRYAEYHQTNVAGTSQVLSACRAERVPKLIYTSSPSVVYGGGDECGVDESAPYPARYLAHYPATKAQAERMVLAANSPTLATVALRPHLIWGPGDRHLLPRLLAKARAGKLRRVGSGGNLVDTTYIDNAVAAHLAALDRLQPGAVCAGKAYFIANGEPVPLWTLIDRLLACADLPPVTKGISPRVAYGVGAVCEAVYGMLGVAREPPMTRFVARQLSTAHWFDLTAARRDLGYVPQVTVAEGLSRLRAALQST